MESLTRNNYEIWFLDYLDGQLSNDQLDTLLDFLEQNPDLKAELQGVSVVGLAAGNESLDCKDLLLKTNTDIPGMSAIDQLCIARMENDLQDEEAGLFDARMEADSELRENYESFRQTRLNPADVVVFPFKKDLLQKTRLLSPWIITAISSAAILLLTWILWPDSKETLSPQMAKTETVKPASENPKAASANTDAPKMEIPVTANAKAVESETRNAERGKQTPKSEARKPVSVHSSEQTPAVATNSVREFIPMESLSHKTFIAGPKIPDPQNTRLLFASSFPQASANPFEAGDVLTLPQYALQLFRERILGEDRLLVRRTRFSMWEVAGAGVNKINDLVGTQMKLSREYDAQGDLTAISFNSRLVGVESPVKAPSAR